MDLNGNRRLSNSYLNDIIREPFLSALGAKLCLYNAYSMICVATKSSQAHSAQASCLDVSSGGDVPEPVMDRVLT